MIRILFQGDSITDGARLKPVECRWDLNHQIGHSFVYPIVGDLGRKHPGKYTIINRGVSGETVASIGARWQEDTLDEHPDILSMLIGINTGKGFDEHSFEGIEEQLRVFDTQYRALLDTALAQNPNLKLILMEPFALPVPNWSHGEAFVQVLKGRQALIRQIAEDYGAIFIPVQARLEALATETAPILKENGCDIHPYVYWTWDGIHPTEPLHHYLAQWWLEAAAPIL